MSTKEKRSDRDVEGDAADNTRRGFPSLSNDEARTLAEALSGAFKDFDTARVSRGALEAPNSGRF
jgi:hypothetical protein